MGKGPRKAKVPMAHKRQRMQTGAGRIQLLPVVFIYLENFFFFYEHLGTFPSANQMLTPNTHNTPVNY